MVRILLVFVTFREAKLERTKKMLNLQRSPDDLAILQAGAEIGEALKDMKEPIEA